MNVNEQGRERSMNRVRGDFQCNYGYLMLGGNCVRVMVHER